MNNNGIHIRMSKYKIALLGVSILLLMFLALLFFAFRPMLKNSENDLRSRHRAVIVSAKNLPDAGQERDAAMKRIAGEFLAIAHDSRDHATQSAAYANAGSLMLRDYVAALKRLEGNKLEKPPLHSLTNAIEYFGEAARICADVQDKKPCFFGQQAQSELDYALLLERDIRAKRSREKQESGKTNTKDFGSAPLESSTQKTKNNPGGTPHTGPIGSIRGSLSEEPRENGRDIENGLPAGGGGFELPANEP